MRKIFDLTMILFIVIIFVLLWVGNKRNQELDNARSIEEERARIVRMINSSEESLNVRNALIGLELLYGVINPESLGDSRFRSFGDIASTFDDEPLWIIFPAIHENNLGKINDVHHSAIIDGLHVRDGVDEEFVAATRIDMGRLDTLSFDDFTERVKAADTLAELEEVEDDITVRAAENIHVRRDILSRIEARNKTNER